MKKIMVKKYLGIENILNFYARFLMIACLFLTPIMAQTSTTGMIEGTVTDANGALVSNAAITISSSSLLRPVNTTSNSRGEYKFFHLPPGKYSVKVESSSGFANFEQANVEVNLSKSTLLNISLKAKGIVETVNVAASGSEIDFSNNTTGINLSTNFFSNIPTSRTAQGIFTIAPTVIYSGLRDASGRERDLSVGGSSGLENKYLLNGVNVTDPAFGGSGTNIPFEFVQEVEIKTGSFGADQGLSTGGIFNVITKSGGNEFHGDVFGYFSGQSLVRTTKNLPFTGLANNGFSEMDAGVNIGGPLIKNKLTFYAAFNFQSRTNNFLTQTFRKEVENKITTPFYTGKLTWLINDRNTLTVSTFGDQTKEEGHLFAVRQPFIELKNYSSGFGTNLNAFQGVRETGGTNYAARLNSNLSRNWIGEFSFGLHRQRHNTIPDDLNTPLVFDDFAIVKPDGTAVPVTQTGVAPPIWDNVGYLDYVYAPGGTLKTNLVREGFGQYGNQSGNRWEAAARFQNSFGKHTLKYGFEYSANTYRIDQRLTGPNNVFADPFGRPVGSGNALDNRTMSGYLVVNQYYVCVIRGTQIVCPTLDARFLLGYLPSLPAGITGVREPSLFASDATIPITEEEFVNSPFLVRRSTQVIDQKFKADTKTRVQSFYVQDDWRFHKDMQLSAGVRADYQQAFGDGGNTSFKLNRTLDNLQPRIGWNWDFTGQGKGKLFMNFARYVEAPIPLALNADALSKNPTQKQITVNRLNAPLNSERINTPFGSSNFYIGRPIFIDQGLKPQTVNETTFGVQYELSRNYSFGASGIYRAQDSVIENVVNGSDVDGLLYYLSNPGEIRPGQNTTEEQLCARGVCTGRARRYYRALEFTLNKRFSDNYSFVSSYVFSSLIGNYEGLFSNDYDEEAPHLTQLFDGGFKLNSRGRLPNDRPHQLKFNGSYQTPFKLMISGNFSAQSGVPFNRIINDFLSYDTEVFGVPRGTATIPAVNLPGAGGVESAIGKSRSPTIFNLDLGIYYPIRISENKQLKLMVDWFNVTNMQRALALDQRVENFTGIVLTSISGSLSNPYYGTGTRFQAPSSIRFGVKFTF